MTILIQAEKSEGATTREKSRTRKRVEAPGLNKMSDDMVSSVRKRTAGKNGKFCATCGKLFIAKQSNYQTCGDEKCKN